MTRGQREKAIKIIADLLSRQEEIVLALVFGGVLIEGKPIRDIGVAVYTGHRVAPDEWPAYVDELRVLLERGLKARLGLLKAVDVVLLEYTPPRLRAKILAEGQVIINRSPGIRGVLLLHALDEARFLQRRRERGLPGRRSN